MIRNYNLCRRRFPLQLGVALVTFGILEHIYQSSEENHPVFSLKITAILCIFLPTLLI